MVMTAAFRLLQGGAAAWVGTVVILSSGSIGLIWRHLRRGSLEKISAGELYIFGVFNHIVMLAWMFMLPLETAITVLAKISGPVIMIYPLCTVALGLLLAGRLRRRQIAAALIESEKTYRLLFHNKHTVMLLIDPKNGSIVDANPAACTFYGWPHNELCRMQISQINTLPLEQLQKHMGNILSLETHEFLFHHRLADGSLRDVEVLSSPVTFGDRQLLYSIIHDVTARNRTATEKANLLAEASKTRHVLLSVIEDQKLTDTKLQITQFALDHSADAVLWVNEKAEFTYVNLAACQSLGYTKKELLTMSVFDIDPAFPPDYWPLHWQNIQTQGSLEFEAFHRNKDGTTFPVEIHARDPCVCIFCQCRGQ
jgi:PAS domain S-box-containing protein